MNNVNYESEITRVKGIAFDQQEQIHHLNEENNRLKEENNRLKEENNRLNTESQGFNNAFKTFVDGLQAPFQSPVMAAKKKFDEVFANAIREGFPKDVAQRKARNAGKQKALEVKKAQEIRKDQAILQAAQVQAAQVQQKKYSPAEVKRAREEQELRWEKEQECARAMRAQEALETKESKIRAHVKKSRAIKRVHFADRMNTFY